MADVLPSGPGGRLSPRARSVWRAEWAATGAGAAVAAWLLSKPLDGALAVLVWIVPVLVAAAAVIQPTLRWRRWRWEVREAEIDTEQGILVVRRTLIPMLRVQHVETTRNVLEQALRLATVKIHTAAGGHTIPLLDARDAARLRDRIAELARTEARGEPDG
jgi:uncharacterized protein